MKRVLAKRVDKHQKLIVDAFNYIWANPETGYKEWKTHAYLKDVFCLLAIPLPKQITFRDSIRKLTQDEQDRL